MDFCNTNNKSLKHEARSMKLNIMSKKPITFILLDESETVYGVSVKLSGVDTEQFEKNPVMFYQHNDWNMPVGKWANIRKENGQLLADAVFDYEDDDKDVKRMIRKVEAGFIKMASCGLVDLDGIRDPAEPERKIVIVKCRLREASIVPIGGNHNAMRLYDKEGNLIEMADDKDVLKLSDFIQKPKINIQMKKETLDILNLADNPTDEMIEAAVLKLNDERTQALADKAEADKTAKELKEKLDAIELADKEAKTAEAVKLVDTAIKDGRLSEKEDGSVKKAWLALFDTNHENAKAMLEGLPVRKSPADSLELGDGSDGKPVRRESEWDKRKKEIDGKK